MRLDAQPIRVVFGGVLFSLLLMGCGANPQANTPAEPAPSATPVSTQLRPSPPPAPTQSRPSLPPAPTQSAPAATATPTKVPTNLTPVPTLVPTTPRLPPAVVPTNPGMPVIGEIPDAILALMLADLSQRAGVAPNEITIQLAEAVTWPDGSLGCPQPNMMYPQVLIDGYRAILVANGREYAYHSDGRGNAFYCARPTR